MTNFDFTSENSPAETAARFINSTQRSIFLTGKADKASSPTLDLRKLQPRKRETAKQASLPLDESTHGIFDKHDRIIVNGQDLDQPTYLRQGLKLQRAYK